MTNATSAGPPGAGSPRTPADSSRDTGPPSPPGCRPHGEPRGNGRGGHGGGAVTRRVTAPPPAVWPSLRGGAGQRRSALVSGLWRATLGGLGRRASSRTCRLPAALASAPPSSRRSLPLRRPAVTAIDRKPSGFSARDGPRVAPERPPVVEVLSRVPGRTVPVSGTSEASPQRRFGRSRWLATASAYQLSESTSSTRGLAPPPRNPGRLLAHHAGGRRCADECHGVGLGHAFFTRM